MAAPALVSRLNDCRSCYKCIRACPTKSISFSDGHAQIVQGECVYCGRCYIACPQDCKIVRDDLLAAKRLVMEGEAYVSLAPSFQAAFPCTSFEALEKGLLDLGFKGVEETAVGATIVKKEYERLVKEGKEDILISTCCHSVNLLVEKHFPAAKKYLAPVLSPMLAHGLDLKKVAAAAGEKSLSLMHVRDLEPVTGYVRGGCSPVGMRKRFPTLVDETAQLFEKIHVSGGRRGLSLIISPDDLARFCDATLADIVR